MHPYIAETKFAIENLLRLAVEEEALLEEKTKALGSLRAQVKVHQWDFQTSDLNDDFSDAYVMAAFARAAKAHEEAEKLNQEVSELEAIVGTHQQAIQAIAGAILQIAKQGISIVHGGVKAAPAGRTIGGARLSDIVWQGRNQAMHFEEGNFSKHVVNLFAILEKEQGEQFSLKKHGKQSMAKQVLHLLGWVEYAAYEQDMKSLLP